MRLPNFDYQNSTIFITIVAKNRRCLFGSVSEGEMKLTREGEIVTEEWLSTPGFRAGVVLYEYQVMPNDFHGILFVPESSKEASSSSAQPSAVEESSVRSREK